MSSYCNYFHIKKETKRNKLMNLFRFWQVKFQHFCLYFLDWNWSVNIKYFTKICLPLINRLNLVDGNIHVRGIFRYRKEFFQILTFYTPCLDTQHWVWRIYKILAINLKLKPQPNLFAGNKFFSCMWLNYILIFCAMTQK